jgi:hypothetical protein
VYQSHTGRLDWALVPAKPAQRLNTNEWMNVQYGVNRIELLDPILCHFSPEYNLFIYFSKIYFNIIPPSAPMSPKLLFYFLYSGLNTVQILLLPLRATYFSYVILLSLTTLIFQSENY